MNVDTLPLDSLPVDGKILVMAGGTGGHIFPGLAVAQALKSVNWDVNWLGTADKMEAHIVPKYGFEVAFINIGGLRNKGWKTRLIAPFKILQSVMQSISLIRKLNPDVVLGMGGYASAPGGIAAWILGKPLVLHEQNAIAGLTNRVLARFATQVLCAFPGAFSPKIKHQVIGNPLRKTMEESKSEYQVSTPPRVLVVGGSLGAKILNDIVPQAIDLLTEYKVSVWHQSGSGHLASVQSNYANVENKNIDVKITEFIDDMTAAYEWADLIICRAGALTVSEVAMLGKPAVFVPLPHAVDDHQTQNALYLVNQGAAKLLPQNEFNNCSLAQLLKQLFEQENTLPDMAKAAQRAAHKDATYQVAKVCAEVMNK